jgi:hypothetical protein
VNFFGDFQEDSAPIRFAVSMSNFDRRLDLRVLVKQPNLYADV